MQSEGWIEQEKSHKATGGVQTSPFDTLKFSTQLREGGFTQQQADTLTTSLQEALSATVATKADLDQVKTELKADIVTLREDMAKGFQDVTKGFQDVYKFMLVSTLTIAGTIIGTAIALVRYLAP